MLLSARKVQEICRGIELLDQGYRKTKSDDSTVVVPFRDISVKTRMALAKNMAILADDYQAFMTAQRMRLRAEELDDAGNIKDPARANAVEAELFEALLEEKEYDGIKLIAPSALPLADMSPTLIKMLLPILEDD